MTHSAFGNDIMATPENYWRRGLIAVTGEANVGKYALTSVDHLKLVHRHLEQIASQLSKSNVNTWRRLNNAVVHLEGVFVWEEQHEVIVQIPNNSHVEVKIIRNLKRW